MFWEPNWKDEFLLKQWPFFACAQTKLLSGNACSCRASSRGSVFAKKAHMPISEQSKKVNTPKHTFIQRDAKLLPLATVSMQQVIYMGIFSTVWEIIWSGRWCLHSNLFLFLQYQRHGQPDPNLGQCWRSVHGTGTGCCKHVSGCLINSASRECSATWCWASGRRMLDVCEQGSVGRGGGGNWAGGGWPGGGSDLGRTGWQQRLLLDPTPTPTPLLDLRAWKRFPWFCTS